MRTQFPGSSSTSDENWNQDTEAFSLSPSPHLCVPFVFTFTQFSLCWLAFSASSCPQWKMLAISAGQAKSLSETDCHACVLIANFWKRKYDSHPPLLPTEGIGSPQSVYSWSNELWLKGQSPVRRWLQRPDLEGKA